MAEKGYETTVAEIVENVRTWDDYKKLESFAIGRRLTLNEYLTIGCESCEKNYYSPGIQAELAYVVLSEQALEQVKTVSGCGTEFLQARLVAAEKGIEDSKRRLLDEADDTEWQEQYGVRHQESIVKNQQIIEEINVALSAR